MYTQWLKQPPILQCTICHSPSSDRACQYSYTDAPTPSSRSHTQCSVEDPGLQCRLDNACIPTQRFQGLLLQRIICMLTEVKCELLTSMKEALM